MLVNAALMLFYSVGAVGGPFAASLTMQQFGPAALFVFMAAVYLILIVIILYRMRARDSVPAERRGRFVALLRTSTVFARLARRPGGKANPPN